MYQIVAQGVKYNHDNLYSRGRQVRLPGYQQNFDFLATAGNRGYNR